MNNYHVSARRWENDRGEIRWQPAIIHVDIESGEECRERSWYVNRIKEWRVHREEPRSSDPVLYRSLRKAYRKASRRVKAYEKEFRPVWTEKELGIQ